MIPVIPWLCCGTMILISPFSEHMVLGLGGQKQFISPVQGRVSFDQAEQWKHAPSILVPKNAAKITPTAFPLKKNEELPLILDEYHRIQQHVTIPELPPHSSSHHHPKGSKWW